MTKTKMMKTIVNCETGEVIEREFTAEEITQFEIDMENQLAIKAAEQVKAAQKSALLERLGLTEDEAKLLLS
jgi:hypothetical protein